VTTLVQARTELDARGYSRFLDARQTTWLNTAKNRFEDYPYDWPWLKSTATGNAPLTISDLRRVRSVVDTSNLQTLEGREAEDVIDYLDDSLTTTGRPGLVVLVVGDGGERLPGADGRVECPVREVQPGAVSGWGHAADPGALPPDVGGSRGDRGAAVRGEGFGGGEGDGAGRVRAAR
jgi:hypothetical protein